VARDRTNNLFWSVCSFRGTTLSAYPVSGAWGLFSLIFIRSIQKANIISIKFVFHFSVYDD